MIVEEAWKEHMRLCIYCNIDSSDKWNLSLRKHGFVAGQKSNEDDFIKQLDKINGAKCKFCTNKSNEGQGDWFCFHCQDKERSRLLAVIKKEAKSLYLCSRCRIYLSHTAYCSICKESFGMEIGKFIDVNVVDLVGEK